MSENTRTFVAVAIPATLETRLTRLQSQLAGEVPEGRWQTVLPFHITLAFLGDVPNTDLNAVCLAVAEAAETFSRFELTLASLGAFPTATRPRTVWTGVDGPGLESLKALQVAVTAALARLDYRPEARPFQPHITLGRFGHGHRPSRDITPVLSHYRTWHTSPFTISEAVTFSSTVTREGPAYAPLGRAPFRGRKTSTSA